jgi:hypothetical protein
MLHFFGAVKDIKLHELCLPRQLKVMLLRLWLSFDADDAIKYVTEMDQCTVDFSH